MPNTNETITYFASPERESGIQLENSIKFATENPVITSILDSVYGLLAVLNQDRQILAVNSDFAAHLGIDDPATVLGLRPGEAINCIHVKDNPNGCGTGVACRSCGAVIAIVSALVSDKPVEKTCAAQINDNGEVSEVLFKVKAIKIVFENRNYVLLFLQDITRQQALASLERVFFHDINNMIQGMIGMTTYVDGDIENETTEAIEEALYPVQQMLMRLADEIRMQNVLMNLDDNCEIEPQMIALEDILGEVNTLIKRHPKASKRPLLIENSFAEFSPMLETDMSLLLRILTNMIINALEAVEDNQSVTLKIDNETGGIRFSTFNQGFIPEDLQKRIFQKNFSTKSSTRGLGTYSMKLFGEKFLKGKVGFESSKEKGTTFWLHLPDVDLIF